MDPELKAHDNKLRNERRKRKREMEAASKSSKHPRLENLAGTGRGCQEGVLTNVNESLYFHSTTTNVTVAYKGWAKLEMRFMGAISDSPIHRCTCCD